MQKNNNILITGATGNIGNAAMNYFEDVGWSCTGIARNGNEKVDSVDLTRSWDLLRLWCRSKVNTAYDIVLMAHGVQVPSYLAGMTEDNWLSVLSGNLSSVIGLTQALVKENKISDNGLIVFCSSIQAQTPRMGRGLYAATKAGVEAFGKTVAVELANMGIRSVSLRLGQLTETMDNVVFSQEEKEKLQERSLLQWVEPIDVVKFVHNLYYQKSITGCVIDMDSGHGRNIW